MCQTTVCHDSRDTAPDLYDKELAVLVREIVSTGAQLVSVKDSCHSRSGLRGDPASGLTPRTAPRPEKPPELRDLLPTFVRDATDPARPVPGQQEPGHVALSACDEWEVANEVRSTHGVHGVFSAALVQALTRIGRDATYRQLLSDARCRVEGRFPCQVPTLEAVGDLADRIFLDGSLRPRAARVTMRCIRARFEVDIGTVHGLVAGSRLAVHGIDPLQEVRVVAVHLDRSTVEPIEWPPDPQQQYEMVLSDVPLPPVAVTIRAGADVVSRLSRAVRTAGPGGGPTPHIRILDPDEAATAPLLLRVCEGAEGATVQITSADHEPLAPPVATDDASLAGTVGDLEHIARWLQVRNLTNPSPALEDAVRIEVLRPSADGTTPPPDSAPLPAGNLEFDYTWTDDRWKPPSVHIRLRNTTDTKLFCVLLDLTDRYRMHAELYPGEYLAAGGVVDVGRGAPITLSLPPDRQVEAGASGTDWLLLLVSEEPFSSDPFSLPRLREIPRQPPARGSGRGISGILGRLGLRAVRRDLASDDAAARDWTAKVVEIRTRVPATNTGTGG
jgi:hypothetical protein